VGAKKKSSSPYTLGRYSFFKEISELAWKFPSKVMVVVDEEAEAAISNFCSLLLLLIGLGVLFDFFLFSLSSSFDFRFLLFVSGLSSFSNLGHVKSVAYRTN
jgi:hypothetical protein